MLQQPQAAAGGSPSAAGKPSSRKQHVACLPTEELPPFRVWQSKQLVSRDLLLLVFLLLTTALYLHKAVPTVCSSGGPANGNHSAVAAAATVTYHEVVDIQVFSQHQQFLRGLICDRSMASLKPQWLSTLMEPANQLFGPTLTAVRGVCWGSSDAAVGTSFYALVPCKISAAVCLILQGFGFLARSVVQAVAVIVSCGMLARDPLLMLLPALRVGLLVLLLLPVPVPLLPGVRNWLAKRRAGSSNSTHSNSVSMKACNHASSSSQRHIPQGAASAAQTARDLSSVIWWYRPQYYWQYPTVRQCVIMVQRLLPPLAAATSVGHVGGYYVSSEFTAFRQLIGQYIYLGWVAFMFTLPFKLHMLVNLAEWLIVFSTAARMSQLEGSSSEFHPVTHLLISLLLVVVLPSFGVVRLELSQKTRYNQSRQRAAQRLQAQLSQQKAPHADVSDTSEELRQQQQQQQQDRQQAEAAEQHTAPSSNLQASAAGDGMSPGHNNSRACSSRAPADDKSAKQAVAHSSNSSKNQFMNDIVGSLHLAAAAAAGEILPMAAASEQPLSPSPQGITATSSMTVYDRASSMSVPSLLQQPSGVLPALSGLLGDQEAAAIFADAAKMASTQPGAVPMYRSMVSALPVSVKVQDEQQGILLLRPHLTGAVGTQLASATDLHGLLPLQMHTICFPGCVHLLASVYSVCKDTAAQQGPKASAGFSLLSPAAALAGTAAADLAAMSDDVVTVSSDCCSTKFTAAEQTGCKGSATLAVAVLQEVTGRLKGLSGQSAGSHAATIPDVQVVVSGHHTAYSSKTISATAGDSAQLHDPDRVAQLQYCQPCCLVASQMQSQQVMLHLQLGGTNSAINTVENIYCRLLAFQGVVLVDTEVVLLPKQGGYCSVSVDAPKGLEPGVLHVALLPSQAPWRQQCNQVASAAPLLLQPLAVLPEQAATELESYTWSLAAAAAASPQAVWHSLLAGITADMAYILPQGSRIAAGSSKATGQGAAAGTTLEHEQHHTFDAAAKQVLIHLCRHLISCQLFETLSFIVEQVAAADAATGSPPAANCAVNLAQQLQGSLKQLPPAATAVTVTTGSSSSSNAATADTPQSARQPVVASSSRFWQLLCGFADPQLEAWYQADWFVRSGTVDACIAAFQLVMGVGCWFAAVPNGDHSSVIGRSSLAWRLWSYAVVFILNVGCPASLLLLRGFVGHRLAVLHSQQQQLQQQQQQAGSSGHRLAHSTFLATAAAEDGANTPNSHKGKDAAAGAAVQPAAAVVCMGWQLQADPVAWVSPEHLCPQCAVLGEGSPCPTNGGQALGTVWLGSKCWLHHRSRHQGMDVSDFFYDARPLHDLGGGYTCACHLYTCHNANLVELWQTCIGFAASSWSFCPV